MSAALSDCGNTRLPRNSVLSATPRLSEKIHHVRRCKSRQRGIQKARVTGTLRRTSHITRLLHTLQHRFRDKQFATSFSLVSSSVTCALLRGSACRHQTSAAPLPITIMFNLYRPRFFHIRRILPDALQLVKCLLDLIAAAHCRQPRSSALMTDKAPRANRQTRHVAAWPSRAAPARRYGGHIDSLVSALSSSTH